MPRCLVEVNGDGYDVTNLMNEESLCQFMKNLSMSAVNNNNSSNTTELRRRKSVARRPRQPERDDENDHAEPFDWSVPLYPNLRDPCNKRLLQDVELPQWKAVPLVKTPTPASEESADKFAEFYELQRRDMERLQQEHQQQQQQHDLQHAADYMTTLPQRAQTAPLHHSSAAAAAACGGSMSGGPSMPSFTSQTTSYYGGSRPPRHSMIAGVGNGNTFQPSMSPVRQSLPPVRRNPHRHSTTAVPGDIDSSSSGLRPRVNYKALYSRRSNNSANSAPTLRSATSSSFAEEDVYCEDDHTSTTMMMGSSSRHSFMENSHSHHHGGYGGSPEDHMHSSSSQHHQYQSSSSGHYPSHHMMSSTMHEEEEEPVPMDEPTPAPPSTMEIAPNVRVAVRSSQETYKAVQSGDYTVATCFACTSTIVCVDDAAYVLCPDCQVVSPLGFGGASSDVASKKDDPYGIGTGLKREWVNEWVGGNI